MAEKPEVGTDISDVGRGSGVLAEKDDWKKNIDPASYYYDKVRQQEDNKYFSNAMWIEAANRGETANLVNWLSQREATTKEQKAKKSQAEIEGIEIQEPTDRFDKYLEYANQGLANYDEYTLALGAPYLDDTTPEERVNEVTGYKYGNFTDKQWAEYILDNNFERHEVELVKKRQQNLNWFQAAWEGIKAGAVRLYSHALQGSESLIDVGESVGYFFDHIGEINSPDFGEKLLEPFTRDEWMNEAGRAAEKEAYKIEYYGLKHIVDPVKAYEAGYNPKTGENANIVFGGHEMFGSTWGEKVTSMINSIGDMLPSILLTGGLGSGASIAGIKVSGKAAALLRSGIFYTQITGSNISETINKALARGLELKDIDAGVVISNAIIKSGFQWGLEWLLGKVIGFTQLDKLMGIGSEEAASAITHIGKNELSALGVHALKLLKDAAKEGLEEFLQDYSDSIVNYAYASGGSSIADIYKEEADSITLESLLTSFVVGAMTSIVTSTVQNNLTRVKNKIGLETIIDEKGNVKKLGWFQTLNFAQALGTIGEWYKTLNDPKADIQERQRASLALSVTIDTLGEVYEAIGQSGAMLANKLLVAQSMGQAENEAIMKLSDTKYTSELYENFMTTYNVLAASAKDLKKAKAIANKDDKMSIFTKVKDGIKSLAEKFKKGNITKINNIVSEETVTSYDNETEKNGLNLVKEMGLSGIVTHDGLKPYIHADLLFIPDSWMKSQEYSKIVNEAGYTTVREAARLAFKEKGQRTLITDMYKKITNSQDTGATLMESAIDALLFDNKMYSATLLYASIGDAQYKQNAVRILSTIDQMIKMPALEQVKKNNLSAKAYATIMGKVYENMKVGMVNYFTNYSRLSAEEIDKISPEIMPVDVKQKIKNNRNVIFSEFVDESAKIVKESHEKGIPIPEKEITRVRTVLDKYRNDMPKEVYDRAYEGIETNDYARQLDAEYVQALASWYTTPAFDPTSKLGYIPVSKLNTPSYAPIITKSFSDMKKFLGIGVYEFLSEIGSMVKNGGVINFDALTTLTSEAIQYFSQYDMNDIDQRYYALDNLLRECSHNTLTFTIEYELNAILDKDEFMNKKYLADNGDNVLLNELRRNTDGIKLRELINKDIGLPKHLENVLVRLDENLQNSYFIQSGFDSTNGEYMNVGRIWLDGKGSTIVSLLHEATHATQWVSKGALNTQTFRGAKLKEGYNRYTTGGASDYIVKSISNDEEAKRLNDYLYDNFRSSYDYLVYKGARNYGDITYFLFDGELKARSGIENTFNLLGFTVNEHYTTKKIEIVGPIKEDGKYPTWSLDKTIIDQKRKPNIIPKLKSSIKPQQVVKETPKQTIKKTTKTKTGDATQLAKKLTALKNIEGQQTIELKERALEDIKVKGLKNPLVIEGSLPADITLDEIIEMNNKRVSGNYDSIVIYKDKNTIVRDLRGIKAYNKINDMVDNNPNKYASYFVKDIMQDVINLDKEYNLNNPIVVNETILKSFDTPVNEFIDAVIDDIDREDPYDGVIVFNENDENPKVYTLDSQMGMTSEAPKVKKVDTEEERKARYKENRVFVSNKEAANSNLKYFIKKGRPILMNKGVRNFIVATTHDIDSLPKVLKSKILNGTLTKADIIEYVATASNIDEYTFKAIAKYVYKNEAVAALTPDEMKEILKHIDEFAALKNMRNLPDTINVKESDNSFDKLFDLRDQVLKEVKTNDKLGKNFAKQLEYANKWYVQGSAPIDVSADSKTLQSIFFKHYDGTLRSLWSINTLGKYMNLMLNQHPELVENINDGTIQTEGQETSWQKQYKEAIKNYEYSDINKTLDSLSEDEKLEAIENYYVDMMIKNIAKMDEADKTKYTQERIAKALQNKMDKVRAMSETEIDALYMKTIASDVMADTKTAEQIFEELKKAPRSKKNIKDNLRGSVSAALIKLVTKKSVYNKLSEDVKKYFTWTNRGLELNDKYQSLSDEQLTKLISDIREDTKMLKQEAEEKERADAAEKALKRRLDMMERKLKKAQEKLGKSEQEKIKLRDKLRDTQQKFKYKVKDFTVESTVKANQTVQDLLNVNWSKKSRMSTVQELGNNQESDVTNSKAFFEQNADTILSADLNDITDTANFFINATPTLETVEEYKRFSAVKLMFLGYVYGQTSEGGLYANLNENLKKEIENALKREATVAGTTLSVWRETLNLVRPLEAMMSQSITLDGLELTDNLQQELFEAIKSDDMEKIGKIQEKIIKYVEENKADRKSILKRIVALRGMSMLSSPMTWLRNKVSNMVLKPMNKIASKLGNQIFKGHTQESQLKLNKPITTDIQNYITKNFIDNGMFDTLVSKLSKYNPSDISELYKDARGAANKEAIMTSLILKSMYNEYYNRNMFKSKAMNKMYSWLMDRLSDDAYVREATIRYFGKILAEKGYTLGNKVTNDIMNDFASAIGLALNDYMHSDNFFNRFESTIKENEWGWFACKTLLPFASASWNWFKEAIRFSPVGLINSIIRFARLNKNIENAELSWKEGKNQINPKLTEYIIRRNLGKGILGTIGFSLGVLLASLGFVRLNKDDYDVPKIEIGDLVFDISSIFGSNSILAGAALVDGFTNDKSLMAALNKSGKVLLENMPLTDLLEIDMYSSGPADIAVDYFEQSLLSFIPNGIAWLAGAYPGTINKNTFLKRAVAKIPGLNWALVASGAVDRKVNPYTGEAGSWIDALNRLIPYVSYQAASINERKTTALGLNKIMLRGQYTINGAPFKVSGTNLQKLNEKYGQWNAEDLTKFYSNQTKVKVKVGNQYQTLSYNQMTEKQRKNAVQNIMSNNADIIKIMAWLSKGHKYYVTDEMYKKLISKGIKQNVYKGTKGFVE